VTDLSTWSNIPFFFLQAGLKNGLFALGVALRPERFRTRRFFWNVSRPLVADKPRGFMYSRRYLEDLWASRESGAEVTEFVSHYQLLPPREVVRQPITYYIDATMRQFFDEYGYEIGRRIKLDALAREREAYDASRFVVCMSEWCAEDVRSSYGVPPDRVRVITPGANIDDALVPDESGWDRTMTPLRLGIVGVDWARKGGALLVEVAERLDDRGLPVEVVVAGPPASHVPSHPLVRPLGFVDKRTDGARFVSLVRSFHFGCLLSRAEALGIFPLECMRLGVPVVVTDAGGLEDPGDAGIRVPVDATAEEIADEIASVAADPGRYVAMREAASRKGAHYTWGRTANEFLALLGPRG
jgi:glycosyltransferase involved in cell wall biosynthesis